MVVRWSATRSSACRPSRSLSASRAEVALSSSSKGLFTTEELGDADRQARRHEQGQGGLAQSQPTRWLYDSQSAALKVVNSSVRIWASVLSLWFGIGGASSGCGSIGWKRRAAGARVVVMRSRSPPPGALRAGGGLRSTSREAARP